MCGWSLHKSHSSRRANLLLNYRPGISSSHIDQISQLLKQLSHDIDEMSEETEQNKENGPSIDKDIMDEGLPQADEVKQTYKSYKYVIIDLTVIRDFEFPT